MATDRGLSGPNQSAWLKAQELLRETYTWLGEISEIPAEQELEILKDCPVGHNTSCFMEGVCIDPSDPRCAKRGERK